MRGIVVRENIGVGDKIQFSSLPENYFRATGEKLIDVSKCWMFDHNPFVVRDQEPVETFELWNFPQIRPWSNPRVYTTDPAVYLSNAEVIASAFNIPVVLNRPRLYRFENFPFEKREKILFHPVGKSHGQLPNHVIDHVIKKYKPTGRLHQIGMPGDLDLGLPRIETKTLWELAEVISQARMFIGADSGPSWIAACYPDVVAKKVRTRKVHGQKDFHEWVPLEIANIHSHWDDRVFQIHNPTEDDRGAFPSYRRL